MSADYVVHCCEELARELDDSRVPIRYNDKIREYGIQLHDDFGPTGVSDTMYFCPWCGTTLPTSLRDEWFDRILVVNPDFELFDEPPPEFRDGGWWRSQGL